MNVESVRTFLHSRLKTTELVTSAAEAIDVSVATMYRYKTAPENIPLGKLLLLSEKFGFPVEDKVVWFRTDFAATEQRRHRFEKTLGRGGRRLVVTPSFSVCAELPLLTKRVAEFDYGAPRYRDQIEPFLAARDARRALYESGHYESFEIIWAPSYLDFFRQQGRYIGITEALREEQVAELVRTTALPHVHRRIYLRNTPELPLVSCYSNDVAVVRVDDFTIEFCSDSMVAELTEIFNDFFEKADLKASEDITAFLQHPSKFLD